MYTTVTENARPSNGRPDSPCKRCPAAAAPSVPRRVVTTFETPKKPAVPSFTSAADAALQELQLLRDRHRETEAALSTSVGALATCEREYAAERAQHAATKAALQKAQADAMAQDFAQLELMSIVKALEAERDNLRKERMNLATEKASLTRAITSIGRGFDELRIAHTRSVAERDSLQTDNATLQARCRELESQLAASVRPPLRLSPASADSVLVRPQPRRFQQSASSAFKARGVTWAADVRSPLVCAAAAAARPAATRHPDDDGEDDSEDDDDDDDERQQFDARQYPAAIEHIVRSLGSRGTDPDTYFVVFSDKPNVAQQCVATELAARPDGKAAIRAFIESPTGRRSSADQHICYINLSGRAYTHK